MPGAHAVHPAPPLPVYPALHVQLLILVAPTSEDEPTGQFEHAAEPVAALNVPAPHCVHTAPFAPVYPALHSHASATPLPTGECEFRGHAWQTVPCGLVSVVSLVNNEDAASVKSLSDRW